MLAAVLTAATFEPASSSLIAIAVIALAVWAADRAEPIYGEKDSGKIVIDEIAGFFVTMTLLPVGWMWIAAGFFVFRAFDVLKPWPIDRSQKLPGGVGVVIDDVLAGVYSCALLHAAHGVMMLVRS